jgi:hypothetical protein
MPATFSECTIYILTKDGRKSCNIFRFENQGVDLLHYDKADFERAFSGVTSGKEFLDQLDGLYEGFLWHNHAIGDGLKCNRWWKEEAASIERICALRDFRAIDKIVLEESIGLSDGDYFGAHFTWNVSSDNSLNDRLEEITTAQWRTMFKIDFQFYFSRFGDDEGFEKLAALSGYKGSCSELIVPRYLSNYKVIDLKGNFLKNNAEVKTVIVPEGYWGVASRCFNNCPNLETILLPTTLVELMPEAIKKCPKAKLLVPEGSKAEDLAKRGNLSYEVVKQEYSYVEKMNAFLFAHGL